MTELLTAAQMRAIEQAAIDSGEVTGLELMERAGRGVVEAILEEWPDLALTSHRAVVLCGPGNNGGDGFVVARLLKERGWEVFVFQTSPPSTSAPDAQINYERWLQLGRVRDLATLPVDTYAEDNPNTAIVIDALFGTGLTRPFERFSDVQDIVNYWRSACFEENVPRVVSLDMPSGLCADSGRVLTESLPENPLDMRVMANLTVTFHAAKRGHKLGIGPTMCGQLRIKSIGLDTQRPLGNRQDLAMVSEAQGGWQAQRAARKSVLGQKFQHGHAFVLSGPPGKGGAARLAARGALRIGAGLVTVACPPGALQENAARLDAIMVHSLNGESQAASLADALKDDRISALCLGPGLGLDDRAASLLACALQATVPTTARGRAYVLDADALTILSRRPDLFALLNDACILTPHEGEFKRLFPDIHAKLTAPAATGPAYSKVDATKEAAARAGCTVLFKGADTVIADPSGHCTINSAHYDRAAPWLATAGSGDVLAGFITGLRARGFSPMQAAETAAWLHVECALSIGPGLIAEDLTEELPKVFRALGL